MDWIFSFPLDFFLYNGDEMKKEFKIDVPENCIVTKHEYIINGRSYYRVTHTLGVIAKHGLANWYLKLGKQRANEIMVARQELGTKVHKLFERTLKGEKIHVDGFESEIQEDVELFHEFRKNTGIKAEALEQKIWSNKHGYAGTFDYVGAYKSYPGYLPKCGRGKKRATIPSRFKSSSRLIGDWKTASAIYEDYWLQLSAYALAVYELTGEIVDGAFIAQFRNGEIKVEERTWNELVELFTVYLAALTLYKWKNRKNKNV